MSQTLQCPIFDFFELRTADFEANRGFWLPELPLFVP
jgi:hypothetical protein